MNINRNHPPAVQFNTLAHELGHLFLGHLGPNRDLKVPQRHSMNEAQRELEAESVAYLVCARNGVTSKSETDDTDDRHCDTRAGKCNSAQLYVSKDSWRNSVMPPCRQIA
jgi:antirestriction protein ArdC